MKWFVGVIQIAGFWLRQKQKKSSPPPMWGGDVFINTDMSQEFSSVITLHKNQLAFSNLLIF